MKVARLSALRTGRLYPPGNIPGTRFCYKLSRPQGHSAARRIVSMENCNDTIGNRTRDLLACNAVPQQTVIIIIMSCKTWLVRVAIPQIVVTFTTGTQGTLKLFETSRPALQSTQPHVQWVLGSLSRGTVLKTGS